MFSKVFSAARRILSRSPSVQARASDSKEETPNLDTRRITTVKMVTSTRRGPVEERTPRSSVRKAKRGLEGEGTPTAAKKRRRSVGGEEEVVEDAIESTEPRESTPERESANDGEEKLPIRRRASPRVVITKSPSQSAEDVQESVDTAPVDATSGAQEQAADIPEPQPASPSPKKASRDATDGTPGSSRKKREKKKKNSLESKTETNAENTGGEEATGSQSQIVSPPKKAHIRFGSEEVEVITMDGKPPAGAPLYAFGAVNSRAEVANSTSSEADESDSDEAPEEVTKESALTKTKAAEAEVARAFEAQQKKEELKRKERAERIAEEQKQKRRKEERKAAKLAKLEAREQSRRDSGPMDVDRHNLPALLPDSILEAAGDRRPPTPPRLLSGIDAVEDRKAKLNRHIKFLERGEKPVKDVKKGSLSVRVLEQQNRFLQPKVNRDTKNVREKWLKGRLEAKKVKKGRGRLEHKKVERRPVGGGFIRGGD